MTPRQAYALANPVVDPPVLPTHAQPYAGVIYDATGVIVSMLVVEQPEGVDRPRWHALLSVGVRGAVRGRAKKLSGMPRNEGERVKALCLALLDGVGEGNTTIGRSPTAWHARRAVTAQEWGEMPPGFLMARAAT